MSCLEPHAHHHLMSAMHHQCISCDRLFQSSVSLDRHCCCGPPPLQNTHKHATEVTSTSQQQESRPFKRAQFVLPPVYEDAIDQPHDMDLARVSDIPPHSPHRRTCLQSHIWCNLAMSYTYHTTSPTMCPMETCHWLTYHRMHPPLPSVTTALPLCISATHLLPTSNATPSKLQSTRLVCLEDTHTHHHDTRKMRRE